MFVALLVFDTVLFFIFNYIAGKLSILLQTKNKNSAQAKKERKNNYEKA